MGRIRFVLLALGSAALVAATGADRPDAFAFDPQPRWAEEPETGLMCEAVARECQGLIRDGEISGSWGYAELYDADGYLVGMRSVGSTGCKPLDEYMLLSHRQFRAAFSKDDKPDLDDLAIETAPGLDRGGIRLVKTGETQLSFGC